MFAEKFYLLATRGCTLRKNNLFFGRVHGRNTRDGVLRSSRWREKEKLRSRKEFIFSAILIRSRRTPTEFKKNLRGILPQLLCRNLNTKNSRMARQLEIISSGWLYKYNNKNLKRNNLVIHKRSLQAQLESLLSNLKL